MKKRGPVAFFASMPMPLLIACFALASSALIGTLLVLFGFLHAGMVLGTLASPLIVGSLLLYILFIHSRSRWPGVSTGERFVRIFTFHRD